MDSETGEKTEGKDNDIPERLFGKIVSKGERMKLQPDKPLGGCWMIRREFVKKLLDGSISEIYFTWVPDRPDWKVSSSMT